MPYLGCCPDGIQLRLKISFASSDHHVMTSRSWYTSTGNAFKEIDVESEMLKKVSQERRICLSALIRMTR
jgi:hypothetical protein